MKPIRSVEEFRKMLEKARKEHEKKNLKNVDLKILENCR